jgi:O-antigen ligase
VTLAFTKYFGVAVKDTATQSGQFVICAFLLLFLAIEMLRRGSRALAGGALALIFFANVLSLASADLTLVPVATLVIIPILLVLLGFKEFSTRAMLAVLAAVATVVAASWIFSPSLRDLVGSTWASVQPYAGNDENPAGTRPKFWKKSLGFIRAAPLRGHGTGSIPDLFARSAVGQTGYSARLTTNPLQQTLAIGIQLGLVGIALLWAMWLSHLLLFRGNGLPEWVGLVIVTQNLVGSLLNSHLFDFTQGWIYVLGVGVAGGLVRQLRDVAN